MSQKNFLIIDGVLIPDMEQNSVRIYEKDLNVYLRMIGGKMVIEGRGKVWVIEASFGDMDSGLLSLLNAVMGTTSIHTITFLPPSGGEATITTKFVMTKSPQPSLKSWMDELPEWSGFDYIFEEEQAHR